jgi:hypothetical protein
MKSVGIKQLNDILERLVRQGHVTRAAQSKLGWSWSPRALDLPKAVVTRLLDDLRQDR